MNGFLLFPHGSPHKNAVRPVELLHRPYSGESDQISGYQMAGETVRAASGYQMTGLAALAALDPPGYQIVGETGAPSGYQIAGEAEARSGYQMAGETVRAASGYQMTGLATSAALDPPGYQIVGETGAGPGYQIAGEADARSGYQIAGATCAVAEASWPAGTS
jgi:hypothetical protein